MQRSLTMPVDPSNPYVDTAHEKVIATGGWTYGCHSSKISDGVGWRSKPGAFKPVNCKHTFRITDPACTDCTYRHAPDE